MRKLSLLIAQLMLLVTIGYTQTVKIGNQVWMTKNLNVDKFRNGDPIPQAKTKEEWEKAGENNQPAWCYYNNDPANGTKYGKLYNWFAVSDPRGLAPVGWHIPSNTEWAVLTDYLGGEGVSGKKMKSAAGWNSSKKTKNCPNCSSWNDEYRRKVACHKCKDTRFILLSPESGNGSNSCGFVGLPSGYRFMYGAFYNIGDNGYFWSSTEYDFSYAWFRDLHYNTDYVDRRSLSKANGFSVRCIKN